MFRSAHRYLKFKPQDGLAVLARGRIDVYEARGEYQLQVEFLEPQGHGALQLAFEQLKKKLAAEGLFDAARKRPLPKYPRRIGIVTSAARRRHPGHAEHPGAPLSRPAHPALSGAGAGRGIDRRRLPRPAILQPLRLGGCGHRRPRRRIARRSLDLQRRSRGAGHRASRVPVISAVGHETDFTIADFVADLRAPTPSAAAELVICTRQELLERIAAQRDKLLQRLRYCARHGGAAAAPARHRPRHHAAPSLHQSPHCSASTITIIACASSIRARLESADRRVRGSNRACAISTCARGWPTIGAGWRGRDPPPRRRSGCNWHAATGRWKRSTAKLSQLSPLLILDRGYAIVTNETGAIVTRSAEAPAGSAAQIRLAEGRLGALVTESE